MIGRISDLAGPKGRKMCLFLGCIASLVGMVIASKTFSIQGLWLSMIPVALLQQNFSILKAMVADLHDEQSTPAQRSSSMGTLGMAVGLAFMVGPLVAATLLKTFDQANALGMGLAILSMASIFILPDVYQKPKEEEEQQQQQQGYGNSRNRANVHRDANASSSSNKKQKGNHPNAHTKSPLPMVGVASAISSAHENRKKEKRQSKREKQLASMKKKADEEDRYFRQCRLEASMKKNKMTTNNNAVSTATATAEEALFGKQGAQGINFGKYSEIKVEVRRAGEEKTKISGFENFDDLLSLDVNNKLLANIRRMNYSLPTPIQKHSIPLALEGDDLMCTAQTGSGKTCAFLLPIVSQLLISSSSSTGGGGSVLKDKGAASPRCVVMAPTRELAIQIELEAQKLCFDTSVRTVTVYGGANARAQLKNLAYGCDICVATPGRLTDFVDRSLVSLSDVRFLVLDEADRMLDMGFEPQIRRLVLQSGMTPKEKRRTLLFSATFEASIQKLAASFLRSDYTWIAVGRVGSTTESITQVIVRVPSNDKRKKLQQIVQCIGKGPSGRTLIFVQKKRTATWLKKQLSKGGPEDTTTTNGNNNNNNNNKDNSTNNNEKFTPIAAEDIHGDRSQSQREAALSKFRAGTCRVLVATDVMARGLDVAGVEHVINMDLPTSADEFDSYVHRIGRTGRAGHTGLATSLFVPTDNGSIAAPLVRQLKESKQEVPDWLEEMVAATGGNHRSGSSGRGGGRGTIGSDVRRSGRGGSGRGGRGRGRGRGSNTNNQGPPNK
eukprot:CAMPEP_0194209016 /NCGR_PEP_ID=MMETSP0156-20130528/7291_1 /TAXON_ID=33649 /ORGANISM="Thalassionema nitzschioides, Strain L26-B" /LENGTH=780 /DNA_ID=CAMNT_0038936101 /DNA_START=238 /DNA_END=2581 /DNA_ORIENTATION=+